jgi:PAS domain S-box-containing protein
MAERLLFEDELQDSDRFQMDIELIARVGGWRANPHTDYLAWSKGTQDIFEIPRDRAPGYAEWLKYFLPEHASLISNKITDCLETGTPFVTEAQAITKTGKRLWTEVRGLAPAASAERSCVIGTVQDITDRKKTEQALRESEEQFRTLADHFPVGIIIHRNGSLRYYGREAARLLGYEISDDLLNRSIFDFVAECDRERLADMGRSRYAGEDVATQYEAKLLKKDGTLIDVMLFSMLIEYEGKTSILAAFADITDRRRVEKELRKSEERCRIAQNASRLGIFDYNMASGAIQWDTRVRELWGVEPRVPITYELFMEGVNPADSAHVQSVLDRALDPACSGEHYADFRVINRSDGIERWVSATAVVFFEQDKVMRIVGTVQDITDRKESEEELKKHRERLEELVEQRTIELEGKTHNLEELNAALRVLLSQRELDKTETEERFVSNIKNLILPYLEKMKKTRLDERQMTYLTIMETHFGEVLSPLLKNVQQFNLTPTEVQIASLVRDGKTTKEIAEIMSIATGTIEIHRKNIRKKLGLNVRKANLQVHLKSLG